MNRICKMRVVSHWFEANLSAIFDTPSSNSSRCFRYGGFKTKILNKVCRKQISWPKPTSLGQRCYQQCLDCGRPTESARHTSNHNVSIRERVAHIRDITSSTTGSLGYGQWLITSTMFRADFMNLSFL